MLFFFLTSRTSFGESSVAGCRGCRSSSRIFASVRAFDSLCVKVYVEVDVNQAHLSVLICAHIFSQGAPTQTRPLAERDL